MISQRGCTVSKEGIEELKESFAELAVISHQEGEDQYGKEQKWPCLTTIVGCLASQGSVGGNQDTEKV